MSDIAQIIDDYERGAPLLRREVAGLTPAQLAAHPIPGTWSIDQIVTHLSDAEMAFADRIKRIIAEEPTPPPALTNWDENLWMHRLPSARGSADETAALVELMRRQTVPILRAQPPAAFARAGVHSAAGPITLRAIVEKAAWHLEHHLRFLREKKVMVAGRGAIQGQ